MCSPARQCSRGHRPGDPRPRGSGLCPNCPCFSSVMFLPLFSHLWSWRENLPRILMSESGPDTCPGAQPSESLEHYRPGLGDIYGPSHSVCPRGAPGVFVCWKERNCAGCPSASPSLFCQVDCFPVHLRAFALAFPFALCGPTLPSPVLMPPFPSAPINHLAYHPLQVPSPLVCFIFPGFLVPGIEPRGT